MSLDAFSIATSGIGNFPLTYASDGFIWSSDQPQPIIYDTAELFLRAKARGSSSKKQQDNNQYYKSFEIFAEMISVKSPFIMNSMKISGQQEQKVRLPIKELSMKIENITTKLSDPNDIVIERAELNYEHRKR